MKGAVCFSDASIFILQMHITVGGFGRRIYPGHQSRFYIHRCPYCAHQGSGRSKRWLHAEPEWPLEQPGWGCCCGRPVRPLFQSRPSFHLNLAFRHLRQTSFRDDESHRASRSRAEQTWTYGRLDQFHQCDKVAGGGYLQVFLSIAAICVIVIIIGFIIGFVITAIISNLCGFVTDESSRVQAKGGIVGACRTDSRRGGNCTACQVFCRRDSRRGDERTRWFP